METACILALSIKIGLDVLLKRKGLTHATKTHAVRLAQSAGMARRIAASIKMENASKSAKAILHGLRAQRPVTPLKDAIPAAAASMELYGTTRRNAASILKQTNA